MRDAHDSAVTVPDVPSFHSLFQMTEKAKNGLRSGLEEFVSATGLPNRFILPKGNHEGLKMDLVVIVTDGEADAAVEGLHENNNFIHYGIKGVYPDKRSHGYPLDRHVEDERLFEELDNFKHIHVKIYNHGEHIHKE